MQQTLTKRRSRIAPILSLLAVLAVLLQACGFFFLDGGELGLLVCEALPFGPSGATGPTGPTGPTGGLGPVSSSRLIPSSMIKVRARLSQSDPLPDQMNVVFRQIGPTGETKSTQTFPLDVNRTGKIAGTFPFGPISASAGDSLRWSLQPVGGGIDPTARVKFNVCIGNQGLDD